MLSGTVRCKRTYFFRCSNSVFFEGLDPILVSDFARVFIKCSRRDDGKGLALDLLIDRLTNNQYFDLQNDEVGSCIFFVGSQSIT